MLRPFLLRRLKRDVETQLPQKHEHVVKCRLSRRQRRLYEEYMASTETSAVLGGGNLLGIINVLMQLRKWYCPKNRDDVSTCFGGGMFQVAHNIRVGFGFAAAIIRTCLPAARLSARSTSPSPSSCRCERPCL